MQKITGFFTEIMRRYLPDPFVFAICLTFLTLILAVVVEGNHVDAVILNWGRGFWALLAFTTQMAVILAAGYVLASAPLVDRMLNRIVSCVHRPRTAIVVATLVGLGGTYLNWGFGLIIGGIVAKKLAAKIDGVHYPLIIASAYSGFTFCGLGLSASIPVLISTEGHPMQAQMGIIPLGQTILSLPMLLTSLTIVFTLPLVNAWLHPAPEEPVIEVDRALVNDSSSNFPLPFSTDENTLANKLNRSRVLSGVIGALGVVYVFLQVKNGASVDLNLINFILIFLGIILLGTPLDYVAKLSEGVRSVSGIILQYPFYAGIMAVMASSGLVKTISLLFVHIATASTLPFWGFVASFFINFFAPSGGGHWVIQGPFMIEAAHSLHASLSHTAMGVMLGNACNDLVQPLWILPALALSKLKLKDVMGFTVIQMFWVAIVYSIALLAWA